MTEQDEHQLRYKAMKKVTLVGAAVNFVLAIVQVLIGVLGHSAALVADGIHTVSDLIGDFAVLLAAKEANKGADEDHPYGHGRIETLATVVLGTILIAVGIAIAISAVDKLMNVDNIVQPESLTIVAAILAIVLKESLFHYTMKAAHETNSKMLEANAWHHRSDVFSSVIVLVGVIAALFGYVYMDVVAAFLVAILITRMGFKMAWESIQELADSSLEQDTVDKMKAVIAKVEGVRNLHMLRTRRMGGYALADVHIQVDPRLSVSEGHQISEVVRYSLINTVKELDDITVHIDPEDDEDAPTCAGLPLRTSFLNEFYPALKGILSVEQVDEITLHYLNGKIDVDVHINDKTVDINDVKQAVKPIELIGNIYLCLAMRDNGA
jgi:cation diffusion facilitator family transporter